MPCKALVPECDHLVLYHCRSLFIRMCPIFSDFMFAGILCRFSKWDQKAQTPSPAEVIVLQGVVYRWVRRTSPPKKYTFTGVFGAVACILLTFIEVVFVGAVYLRASSSVRKSPTHRGASGQGLRTYKSGLKIKHGVL